MQQTRWISLLAVIAILATSGHARQSGGSPNALKYSAALFPEGRASDVALDASGKLYVAGTVCDSGSIPVTANAVQPTRGGGCDGFIVVLGTNRQVVYATYLGGSGQERVDAVAVDAQGGIYVTGDTGSSNFPTTAGAYDRLCGDTGQCYGDGGQTGGTDGFVTKLTAAGAFAYSTFLGGSETDLSLDIAVDSAGRAHVAGYTYSPDFPTTAGAVSPAALGFGDATYSRLEPAGNALSYSTYIAGEREDAALAVAVDGTGAAYVTGNTDSSQFPTSVALQPTPGGGGDVWLMKIAADRTLQFLTFVGGSGRDIVNDIALRDGFAYITGFTCSANFPGAPARVAGACSATFASRIAGSGNSLDQTGLVEGTRGRAIAVDAQHRAYLLGLPQTFTGSPVFAPSPDAFQPTASQTGSMTLAVLAFTGTGAVESLYASFVGEGGGTPEAIHTDGAGGVVLGGMFVNFGGPQSFPMVNAPFWSNVGGSFVMHFVPEAAMIANTEGDITLYAEDASALTGNWRLEVDPSAALGRRVTNRDLGVLKLSAPRAAPPDYVEFTFNAEAGVNYRLWIRGQAERDHWSNDSVFVQFSDSVTQAGAATWRIGSTSATTVNLEDCTSCGVKGWGWQDNGYGAGVLGTPVRFATPGPHTIRIQPREDGFSLDQIVLSSVRYLTSTPGPLKQATTVLPRSDGSGDTPGTLAEIFLHTAGAVKQGAWVQQAQADAASGAVVVHPDAGGAKVTAMPVPAVNYVELSFDAEAGRGYRLWLRGRADRDYWGNDSVHVQFSDSVTAGGAPVWRIGSASSTEVNLEDCTGCGLRGWGWQDNGWGVGVQGPPVYFASTGRHVIRVTTREDGFRIDQIVLSSGRYLTAAPGPLKNDTTILPRTQ